jgi:hypothetical protein
VDLATKATFRAAFGCFSVQLRDLSDGQSDEVIAE